MKCKGNCNEKYYANVNCDGYCSICYQLIVNNMTYDEYIEKKNLPLKMYVKKKACDERAVELIKQKLSNVYIWNNSLFQVFYIMTKNKIFFTAEQADDILKGKNNWIIDHLIYSRVIDTWNINNGIDLRYPSGKIFQACDIIGNNNMDMYNKLLGISVI